MSLESLTKTPALARVSGAQTNAGVTTPDIWSTKLNVKLYERTYLKNITNNNWENEAKGPGDTIYIREVPDIPIRRYIPGQPMKRDRAKYKSVPLVINKTAAFALEFEDVEKLQSDLKVQADFVNGATKNMDEYMSADLLQTVYSKAGITFTLASPTADQFFQAYMKALMLLGQNKVNIMDPTDLWSVAPYQAFYLMGTGAQTKAQDMGAARSTVLSGKPSDAFAGVQTYFSNQCANVGGNLQVLIGHKMAITWAMQMDRKMETLRNPDAPGDIVRGMCLYAFEVVKPEALVCINVTWPAI
jgi:hypothetical protein